jgi:hypothetical protein
MTDTPIYAQLVRERGELRRPTARALAFITSVWDSLAALGMDGLCPDPATVARRAAAAARRQAADVIFHMRIRPERLVLDEPVYDSVVNDMGYPHCSPVEALACYVHRPPQRYTLSALFAFRWGGRR